MSLDRGASPQNALCAFLLFVASFGLTWAPAASAQALSYCFGATCYTNLAEAESAMMSSSVYGALLLPAGKTEISASRTYTLKYRVEDQLPEQFYVSYASTSFESSMPGCSSDNPYYPSTCSSEEQAMQVSWNSGNIYRPKECVVGTPALAGSYVDPYVYATESRSGDRGFGLFHFEVIRGGGVTNPGDTFRRADYQITCGNYYDKTYFFTIDKKVAYMCPRGFRGTAVGSTAAKPPIQGTKWCRPFQPLPQITVMLRQFESCPANAHPCFPGTGDKMRVEPDFEISGWTFARVYHSLAELDAGAISQGWSTTFAERVLPGSTPALVTESGFYESLVSMGGSKYRSSVHPDRILEVLGSPAGGFRTIRGSEIKEFDASGRLTKLRDANNGARDVEIFYTGSLLTSLRTAQGRTITFSYEAGRLSTAILPDGAVIEYGFDANGNLATVRQAGVTRTYIYGEPEKTTSSKPHLLTGIVDESGQRYASFYYDSDGRVVGSHLHSGQGAVEATTVQYTGVDSVLVSSDGVGTRTITYAAGGNRMPVSIIDQTGTRANTYAGALLTKSIDQKGTTTTYEYAGGFLSAIETADNSPERRKTVYTRDVWGRVTKKDVSGLASGSLRVLSSERRAYSASGALVASCEVDPNISVATAYSCGSLQVAPQGVRQTLKTYCSQDDVNLGVCPIVGLVTSVDGPRTDVPDVTTYHYYAADHPGCAIGVDTCLWRRGDLSKVTDPSGATVETLRYDGGGRPISRKSQGGVVSDLEYDARGRLVAIKLRGAN